MIERCSPQSVPFPPQPPRKVALPCSAGSQVLRHSPTSPVRACPPFGLWPSRTGLDHSDQGVLEISRFSCMLFLSVRGFLDYAGPNNHSRLTWLPCCLPPLGIESASCSIGFSKLNSPAHRYLCLRFERHLAMLACKTQGQDGVAVLLSCRALSSPTTCRFIPAHSGVADQPGATQRTTRRSIALGLVVSTSDGEPGARQLGSHQLLRVDRHFGQRLDSRAVLAQSVLHDAEIEARHHDVIPVDLRFRAAPRRA